MKRSRPLRRVPLRRAGYLDRSTPLRPGPPPKRRTELRRFRPLVAAASLAASPAQRDDMNAAIDVIGEMFKKYSNVLTAGSWLYLEPTIQEDWTAIFRVPWIP